MREKVSLILRKGVAKTPCTCSLRRENYNKYIANHPYVYSALKENRGKYWTNDLAYDLICGILDIKSNHYDERNSLASKYYKFSKNDLKTNLGQLYLMDDKE